MSQRATDTPRRRARWRVMSAMALALFGAPSAERAAAQTVDCSDPAAPGCRCGSASCPSEFGIENVQISKSNTTIKFQARVSQAKIPLGNATFDQITTEVLDGNSVVCSETLTNKSVVDSILNLEIGAQYTCDFESIVARSTDLKFRVCLGTGGNCLKPVKLSTVPYSIKSTYAKRAQEAYIADKAAQCHYAHRIAGDLDLFVSPTDVPQGSGFYDFRTPLDTDNLSGLSNMTGSSLNGGYIQWQPINSDNTLNICSREMSNGALVPLDELVLHATNTGIEGNLHVTQNARTELTHTVDTRLDVIGHGIVRGANAAADGVAALSVQNGLTHVEAGLLVTGTQFGSDMTPWISGATVHDVPLTVYQTSGPGTAMTSLMDGLLVSGEPGLGEARITNIPLIVQDGLSSLQAGAIVSGAPFEVLNQPSTFTSGAVTVDGGAVTVNTGDVTVAGGDVLVTTGDMSVPAGDLTVGGVSTLDGATTITAGTGQATDPALHVVGTSQLGGSSSWALNDASRANSSCTLDGTEGLDGTEPPGAICWAGSDGRFYFHDAVRFRGPVHFMTQPIFDVDPALNVSGTSLSIQWTPFMGVSTSSGPNNPRLANKRLCMKIDGPDTCRIIPPTETNGISCGSNLECQAQGYSVCTGGFCQGSGIIDTPGQWAYETGGNTCSFMCF